MPHDTKQKIQSFTDIIAWQQAHDLVLMVYATTQKLPNKEKFNVIDQLERAAVSITNNIAEGFGRQSAKEMTHFLFVSLGSLKEVENMLEICKDLNYVTDERYQALYQQSDKVSRLLRGLIKANKSKH